MTVAGSGSGLTADALGRHSRRDMKAINEDENSEGGGALQSLVDSLDADLLAGDVPREEVQRRLREAGGDPAAIVARGRAKVDALLKRRTKRRYAHELYPHPKNEDELRPLSVEVPYLYAHAVGMDISGTGWDEVPEGRLRVQVLVHARQMALLADAVSQGLTGDEAWAWAHRHMDESGEMVWDRAVRHGVDPEKIKPYLCGGEPDKHYHQSPTHPLGYHSFVAGPESACEQCTEPGEEG